MVGEGPRPRSGCYPNRLGVECLGRRPSDPGRRSTRGSWVERTVEDDMPLYRIVYLRCAASRNAPDEVAAASRGRSQEQGEHGFASHFRCVSMRLLPDTAIGDLTLRPPSMRASSQGCRTSRPFWVGLREWPAVPEPRNHQTGLDSQSSAHGTTGGAACVEFLMFTPQLVSGP